MQNMENRMASMEATNAENFKLLLALLSPKVSQSESEKPFNDTDIENNNRGL